MKSQILNIFLLGLLFSCNSNSEVKNISSEIEKINLEELEKKGFELYQKIPSDALPIFKQVALEYESLGNSKKAGFSNLNIANIYDEHLNQVDSAIIYSAKSLKIWALENDSIQMANLYKYIGLLKGKKGLFTEAKSSIQKAIVTYRNLGFEEGVAVSEINLADTYFREKDYEKSLRYYKKSKEFWILKNDKSRIYTDNIVGIKIFSAMKRDEAVASLINENRKIEKETEVNNFANKLFGELIAELKKEPE